VKLILVRHAVTAETGRKLSGRTPGISLSTKGLRGASDLASELASLEPVAVYCSPIERCRETATILGKPHGLRPRLRRGLIEADYGDWSGRSLRSLQKLKAWGRLMSDPAAFRFPGGETLEEVRRRVVRSVAALADRHSDEMVLAVSHSDVIRVLVADCLTGGVDSIHRISVSPLGVSVFERNGDGPLRASTVNAPRL